MRRLAAFCGLLLVAACSAPDRGVDPARYDAFFVWAGVNPPPAVSARARTLYLLAGEVRRDGRYVALRATPQIRGAEVWLVIRAAHLDWSPALKRRILAELDRWAAGNRLAGLQVDFDASTRGLDRYATFLKDLRRDLPPQYRLSVTGLMDWSANGDPAALAGLKGVVDEIVVQSYQGRHTIPGYDRYLAKMARLPVPFRVAVVEGGEWIEPAGLAASPNYRGKVLFLLRRPLSPE